MEYNWERKKLSAIDYMNFGNFSLIEGKWKNASGSEFEITGDNMVYVEDLAAGRLLNGSQQEPGSIISINVIFDEMLGAMMVYIPASYEDEIPFIDGEATSGKEKIVITQDKASLDEVFYRVGK